MPASTKIFIIRYATSAVLVAGLEMTGMPASSAHAAFSASPQAGKLKAFTWTATPGRGTSTCCATKRGDRPSWMPSPSIRIRSDPSCAPRSA